MKIEIVEDIKKRMKSGNQYVKEVVKGKARLKKAEKTLILTPDVFSKVFSPQRIRLLIALKKNKIKSIYQLAKSLNRRYEAVHRDIKYLEGLGLIKIKEKEKAKIPYIEGKIEFAMAA